MWQQHRRHGQKHVDRKRVVDSFARKAIVPADQLKDQQKGSELQQNLQHELILLDKLRNDSSDLIDRS